MEKPSCADCKFFTRPGRPGELYGVCVRFPAVMPKHESDWCGEFVKIAETKLKEPKRP